MSWTSSWNETLLYYLGKPSCEQWEQCATCKPTGLHLTLIDPNAHYDPIPVKKPQKTSRRINNPGIIGACHCGAEYETEYSVLIKTHTATSIDSAQPKSTDAEAEKSVNICQGEWENDYYIPSMATHTMHTEEYDEDYEEERDWYTLDLTHFYPWYIIILLYIYLCFLLF